MISVRDIHKSYGKIRAVRGIGFDLDRGQVAGLLGPNGAGKSTTIRIVTGYLPQDSGTVTVNGADASTDPIAARRAIGYLPESAPAYPEMTPHSYLALRAGLYGLRGRDRRDRIEYALERCRLTDMRRRRIGHLSKGYKQRVGLAAALLHDPPVLVLDEPTNGLDPTQIREARSLVRELAEDKTMLVSSHILPEIELLCDRAIIVAGGRVRADDPIDELGAADPRYTAEGDSEDDAWLWAVVGVGSVTRSEHAAPWSRWTIEPKPGAPDLREPIARAASGAGVTLRELARERAGLESVFMRVIEEGDE